MPPLTGNPNLHATKDFIEGLVGHCLCGSVNVTINDPDLFTRRRGHLCHCANCRKVSGSFAASNLIIEQDKIQIEDRDSTLAMFLDTETGSGIPIERWFCSRCGNPIKSVTPTLEGKVVMKMGLFPRIPAPEFETFGLHRHEWQGYHPGVEVYKIKAFGEKV
ncbi:hypothetical protein N7509_001859 [Penicillium cosmopolitanum]|uniref:CENP-V/GFA domain-containing protein n=1 Tax=Penicillium cosmopolitanum TaxID=1131564 RepID=A0A9W9W7R5_9EURO|nr:uncharacterized protein N7509_001859 [Penicillium cosmopolitanum]KAJ5407976.1 hypothetical protein N7509_001859 [Penicillium cosmopolitanum]